MLVDGDTEGLRVIVGDFVKGDIDGIAVSGLTLGQYVAGDQLGLHVWPTNVGTIVTGALVVGEPVSTRVIEAEVSTKAPSFVVIVIKLSPGPWGNPPLGSIKFWGITSGGKSGGKSG